MAEKIITRVDQLSAEAIDELSNGRGNEREEMVAGAAKIIAGASYSNSPLVNYTLISPNKTIGRNHAIDTITIHCVVGQVTVEALGSVFAPAARQASSNYGVGYDGRIGLYCDEKDRSWCTSSAANDNRAITIEVASDTFEPYAVKDAAYQATIKLVADICKRNNIKKLLWVNDKSLIGNTEKQNMTVHRWFAAKACPGDYLFNRMSDIASKVNVSLGSSTTNPPTTNKGVEYKLVTKVKTYSSAADAKAQTNAKGSYDVGTYYVYNKYPNGLDGMYNISKDSTGNSAGSWINPKENVIANNTGNLVAGAQITLNNVPLYNSFTAETQTKTVTGTYYIWSTEVSNNRVRITNSKDRVGVSGQVTGFVNVADTKLTQNNSGTTTPSIDNLYRVRKSKDDSKTQYGAYSKLEYAITACQEAGPGYHVFDSKYNIVYSYTAPKEEPKPTPTPEPTPPKEETKPTTAVYDLDYPIKTVIVNDLIAEENNKECVKAIKAILNNNPDFNIEIAKTFFKLAPIYDIDPMMAIAQSILETGWFKFAGSSVSAKQHNYCGLGAVGGGAPGASFDTIADGVRAQLQHLYAYGCKDAIPNGEKIVDPRFSLVTRGIARYWQQLAGRWAVPGYDNTKYTTPEAAMKADDTYGQRILKIKKQLDAVSVTNDEIEKYFPSKVEPEPDKDDNKDNENKEDVNYIMSLLRRVLEFFIKLFHIE